MTIRMDWNDATFKASDVIKLITGVITITAFAITLHIGLGNLTDNVKEIRQTQIENTKKNDLRWEAIQLQINEADVRLRLLDQRVKILEEKANIK